MDRFKKQELRRESLQRVRGEIVAERAAALARITRTLEGNLARLEELRRKGARSEADAEGRERRIEYERRLHQARTYLWYLKIQREVNGLLDNDALDERYPMPGPLR